MCADCRTHFDTPRKSDLRDDSTAQKYRFRGDVNALARAGVYTANRFLLQKPDITFLTSHFAVSNQAKRPEHCEFAPYLALRRVCLVCVAFQFFTEVCTTSDVEIEAALMANLM